MKSRLFRWTALTLLLAIAGVAGVGAWRSRVLRARDRTAFEATRKALREGRGADALALFRRARQPESSLDWDGLEVGVMAASRQLPRLMSLHERTPARLHGNEEACLLVARVCLHSGRRDEYRGLAEIWRRQAALPESWFALEVDALLLDGRPAEARRLLESRAFDGARDVPRRVRLALLDAGRDLTASWNHLAEAARLDPRNSEVRSFRGQLLEQIGKRPLARVEYVAASVAEPENPLWRDQLAEFYRRGNQLDLAMDTWEQALALPSLDFQWLKAAFGDRMFRPVRFPQTPAPAGTWGSLAEQIRALPRGAFWMPEPAGATTVDTPLPVASRPEIHWLRMADALKRGDLATASSLHRDARPASRALAPDLDRGLARWLHFRQHGSLRPPGLGRVPAPPESLATGLAELERWAAEEASSPATFRHPPEREAFLRGSLAPAAWFLAAGWREAGLALLPDPLPREMPAWMEYAVGQSLRMNRGHGPALDFLAGRPASPSLDLLRAEILIASGNPREGLAMLERLAPGDSEVGRRAAWLLCLADLERGRVEAVRQRVAATPRLQRTPLGTELLARAALAEGDTRAAEQAYRSIGGDSEEAMAFLAHEALARGDVSEARRWNQHLLSRLPDVLQLRQNLVTLESARKAP